MDQKYFSEIEARCEGDVPDIAAPVFRDRHALLAEVERLTKENQGLRANSMIQEHIISGGRDPIKDGEIMRLIMDNAAKDQQIATLKKALELACDSKFRYMPKPDYFIHQAQEQEGKK